MVLRRRRDVHLQRLQLAKACFVGHHRWCRSLHAEQLMLAIAGDLYATKVLAAGSNAFYTNHDKTELAGCKTLAARTRGT